MKFKVKDLSKCHGKIVALLSEMYQYSGKVLEFYPDRYNRTGIFMYDDWFFEADWLEPVEDIDDSNKIESLDKSARPTEEPSTESRPRTSKDSHDAAMKAIKNDIAELIKDMDVRMLTEEEIKEKVFKDIIPDTKVSIPEGSHVGKVFTSTHDVVNRPDHYHFSEFEPIKVIQAWDLSFALGNVVKYIARAGRKDSSKLIEDLEKAKRYLELELEHLRKK